MAAGGVLTQDPKTYSDSCQRKWLVSNYEAGDVVFHNSYMVGRTYASDRMDIQVDARSQIHASTMNHDKDGVIRLGTDLRFVDTRKPWDIVSSPLMVIIGYKLTVYQTAMGESV